ncbi:MAG: nucleotidyltransferase domain-containing protein [Candidatus Micrarchaeota archaeon]
MFKKLNLFSKTEMKVLDYISVRDGELFERQIANGAGISAASANRMLKMFAKLGLLKQTRKGKMLFYLRNDGNPVLRQYKVFTTVNNLMPAVEKIAPFSQRILLFGSAATGRNGENSDIDLFVLSGEKEKTRARLREEERIKAIIMNGQEYAELRKKDKPLYERINSGIELFG